MKAKSVLYGSSGCVEFSRMEKPHSPQLKRPCALAARGMHRLFYSMNELFLKQFGRIRRNPLAAACTEGFKIRNSPADIRLLNGGQRQMKKRLRLVLPIRQYNSEIVPACFVLAAHFIIRSG